MITFEIKHGVYTLEVGLDFSYTYKLSGFDENNRPLYTRADTLLSVYENGQLIGQSLAGLDSRDTFKATRGRTIALEKVLEDMGTPREVRKLVWEGFHKHVKSEAQIKRQQAVKKAKKLLAEEGYDVTKRIS